MADGSLAPPVVSLTFLGRKFHSEPPVDALVDVNLTVNEGDWVAVVGPSGSGKSTLLNIIGCLDTQTSGSYRFDGVEVADLSDRQRAGLRCRGIGFVFQSFHLLGHRTVTENVMLADVYRMAPSHDRRSRAAAALDTVGLGHRSEFLPTKLSGGERQRVAIARAIVTEPSMILADEPTGNLDTATGAEIIDVFRMLHADGATVVVITHDREIAASMPRVIHIRDGRVENGDVPNGFARA